MYKYVLLGALSGNQPKLISLIKSGDDKFETNYKNIIEDYEIFQEAALYNNYDVIRLFFGGNEINNKMIDIYIGKKR